VVVVIVRLLEHVLGMRSLILFIGWSFQSLEYQFRSCFQYYRLIYSSCTFLRPSLLLNPLALRKYWRGVRLKLRYISEIKIHTRRFFRKMLVGMLLDRALTRLRKESLIGPLYLPYWVEIPFQPMPPSILDSAAPPICAGSQVWTKLWV